MKSRQAYIDRLRIAAIVGVLFFHSAMPFVAEWEWHIKNNERSNLLMEFNFFLSRFRMPLLFFISGAVTCFMLQKRTAGQFIGLRFRRLFIPLLTGMLLVVPPQVYMERLNQGYTGNYFDFYPTIFTTGPYPEGNMSWHHLWFIIYLLVYDVLLAPLFKWMTVHADRLTFFNWLGKGQRIYLLTVIPAIAFSLMVLRFPQTHNLVDDWCWFFYWLFFLLAGFICMLSPSLTQSLENNRRISLSLAVLTLLFINYCRWNNAEPEHLFTNWRDDPRTYLYFSLYAITAWTWVFALVGYGKKYLNRPAPALQYANQAVYPFYVLHQTIIIVIGWYVVQTNDTVGMKYIFTVTAAFLVSMLLYHLFIRPFAITRFLFGMKADDPRDIKQRPAGEGKPGPTQPATIKRGALVVNKH